ncbi:hypothetical protein RI129_002481 [Pyrocoelia pectoralis]|uniref:Transmembrane protein 222 n=1 Tax=Pyrocoelia pectoralis TaxID=417401 RepID=A0AAN7VIZ8_9COLE
MYKTLVTESNIDMGSECAVIDIPKNRYPFCIVWTPIPFLTWLFPVIGHMGVALSSGVIRDFAGPYYVSEDNMAFGNPTKYWQLKHSNATGGVSGWDRAITEASDIYKERMHNLFCDNCHSHVATALNIMQYKKSSNWNMIKLAFLMLFFGKYVSFVGFLKTWLPFLIILTIILALTLTM